MTEAGDPTDVFHLPGLAPIQPELISGWYEGSTASGYGFRAPALTGVGAARVATRVRETAIDARRQRRLAEVVRSAATAGRLITDGSSPTGAAAVDLLGVELGWPRPLAQETLAEMGRLWTEEALWNVLKAELPDPGVLDGFSRESDARQRRAEGPPLLLQIMAANVPGVAVTGVIRGLLCRSGVLVKVPEDSPGLVALFGDALSRVDPLLGGSLAATWWPADREAPLWDVWATHSGKVVVYGGDEAVAGVRARTRPDQDLVAYGPKVGVAVVLPDAEPAAAAAALARDVCAYEQQGCVSPRLALVVEAAPRDAGTPGGASSEGAAGGRTTEVASSLERALSEEATRISRPRLRTAEASAIRTLRAEAEFRGYAGRQSRVMGPEDLSWTLLIDDPPVLDVEPLPRVVRLAPVATVGALKELLAPLSGRIQAVGYAGGGGPLAELASAAAELRVSRVSPLGRMAWPPADWRHDGRFQLLPLLEWTDWEIDAGFDGGEAD